MTKARLEILIDALTRAAQGDFAAEIQLTGDNDELDAVALGLMMMFEDLATMDEARSDALQGVVESENRLRSFTDAARDAIIFMDPDGNIDFWNPAAVEMFGYSEAEALGQPLHELLMPHQFRGAKEQAFPRFQESGEGAAVGNTVELTSLRKGGEEFPVELSLAAIPQGERWGAVGIVRDITERKAAEQKAATLQADVMKTHRLASLGVLARGAAH